MSKLACFFERLEQHRPDTQALSDGVACHLSYRELNHSIDFAGEWLAEYHLEGVALMMDNSPAQVVLDLAALKSGLWTLPLPPFFTAMQMQHALMASGCQYLLSDVPLAMGQVLSTCEIVGRQVFLSRCEPQGDGGDPACGKFKDLKRASDVQIMRFDQTLPGTAKVTFTSGSTGSPKGLCLAAEHLLAPAISIAECLAPHGLKRHLSVLPHSVLLETIAGVYAALYAGLECIIPSLNDTGLVQAARPDIKKLHACLQNHAANSCILVPELLNLLVAYMGEPRKSEETVEAISAVGEVVVESAKDRGMDSEMDSTLKGGGGTLALPDLVFVAVGGAHVGPELLSNAQAVGLPVFEGYGLSEAGSVVSVNLPGDYKPGSTGRPLPHQSIFIAADGELYLGSASFLGYCGTTPCATRYDEANGVHQVGHAFPTGDLARIDDGGYLFIEGRKKNVLITSMGRNVSPEWVENACVDSNVIHQAFVFGDGQAQLSALVVATHNDEQLCQRIEWVNSQLPDYARIGKYYRVEPFTRDNQSLTANGKLCRDVIYSRYVVEQNL